MTTLSLSCRSGTAAIETGAPPARRIETVFDYAKAHGWRTGDNPAAWGVFEHILQAQGPTGPKGHHPALDWRETPAFMARSRSPSRAEHGGAGARTDDPDRCRSGEVRGTPWTEIDYDTATWTVPAERMKRRSSMRLAALAPDGRPFAIMRGKPLDVAAASPVESAGRK